MNPIDLQIKAVNEKSKKSWSWSLSVDLFLVFQPNLNLKPSVNEELSLEEDMIERFMRVSV